MPLYRCAGCARHIRETDCPFCGHVQALPTAGISTGSRPLTRAAVLLGAALGVASAAGCAEEDPVAAYGGPPLDLGVDAVISQDASGDDLGVIEDAATDAPPSIDAAYGGPPLDMGQDDAGPPDSGPIAAYGAPPLDLG